MSASDVQEGEHTVWYIGQHERDRPYHVSKDVLQTARDQNYDMVTARITNEAYHARVLSQLTSHMQSLEAESAQGEALSSLAPIIPPLTMSDTDLSPDDATSQLLLRTSKWIDLDSSDPIIADVSRQVLVQEINFASFCGATNIIVYGPNVVGTSTAAVETLSQAAAERNDAHFTPERNVTQFAHAIEEALSLGVFLNIQILLPMTVDSYDHRMHEVGNLEFLTRAKKTDPEKEKLLVSDPLASWDAWNIIRSVCRYSPRLSVALSLPKKTPSAYVQDRWFSEPLRILELPGAVFLMNGPGNHVLSSSHQQLLSRYMRLRNPPWILLSNVEKLLMAPGGNAPKSVSDPTPAQAAEQSAKTLNKQSSTPRETCVNYIRYLQRRQPRLPPIERFATGYQDYLQSPLQPLTDNLESITYEVFEKDPVKYEWYERAIAQALRDWVAEGKYASGPDGRIVVAVVGAGRGPLVTRALQASDKTGIPIDMWAVEKNQNAFVLLQRHNARDWDGRVSLVQSDMRSWAGPTGDMSGSDTQAAASNPFKASEADSDLDDDSSSLGGASPVKTPYTIDILVSELLGSFADNELSPECLDGAQHLLNPLHGLSIPTSYTAHMTPVAAPKLHADITGRERSEPNAADIPYVVMLQAIDFLSTEITAGPGGVTSKPVVAQAWEFTHPVPQQTLLQVQRGGVGSAVANRHNARAAKTTFKCANRGVCHGIAGYFESVLYASAVGGESEGDKKEGNEDEEEEDEHRVVELSTHPLTIDAKSKDMISWFPIYFPLQTPLEIPDNSELDISMWRRTDGRRVWYEWLVEVFMGVPQKGWETLGLKRSRVGMSRLHSSEKNACLM